MKIVKSFVLLGLLILISGGCGSKSKKPEAVELELSAIYKLNIVEPSGLAIDITSENLWTVSDENSAIYYISPKGEVLDTIFINGDDLEGITIVDKNTIAVVLERSRELVLLNRDGSEIKRKSFDIKGEVNEGLEGIAFNSTNDHFYVINEKAPRLLIELDHELSIIAKTNLSWASDFSGIYYEENENVLWIISDESKMISKCNLDGSVIKSFKIDLPQIEGIAVNMDDNKIYVVSDITAYLYVFNYID
jgi:uncharacterized protein YjiK